MEEKKASENVTLQSPPPASGATPDYAAGLSTPSYAPPTPQPPVATSMISLLIDIEFSIY